MIPIRARSRITMSTWLEGSFIIVNPSSSWTPTLRTGWSMLRAQVWGDVVAKYMLPRLTEFQIWGLAYFPSAITFLRSYSYYFTMSVLNEKITRNFTCTHSMQWFPTSSLPTDQTLLGGAPSTYLIWQTWHKESTVHLSQETLQFIRILVHLTGSGVTWELRKHCQSAWVWSKMS